MPKYIEYQLCGHIKYILKIAEPNNNTVINNDTIKYINNLTRQENVIRIISTN